MSSQGGQLKNKWTLLFIWLVLSPIIITMVQYRPIRFELSKWHWVKETEMTEISLSPVCPAILMDYGFPVVHLTPKTILWRLHLAQNYAIRLTFATYPRQYPATNHQTTWSYNQVLRHDKDNNFSSLDTLPLNWILPPPPGWRGRTGQPPPLLSSIPFNMTTTACPSFNAGQTTLEQKLDNKKLRFLSTSRGRSIWTQLKPNNLQPITFQQSQDHRTLEFS